MILNTEFGPFKIGASESIPEGAMLMTQENPDGTTSFVYLDGESGKMVSIANINLAELERHWMEGTLSRFLYEMREPS